MRTFSAQGVSPNSMEAAMADAMAKANAQAYDGGSLDISVAGMSKEGDNFIVIVTAIAHTPDEDAPAEEEGGDEAGGRGRDNARMARRAEEVSQQLRDEMLHQFHVDPPAKSMDEALAEGEHFVESSPDTTAYVADPMQRAEERENNDHYIERPAFDVVQEAGETVLQAAADAPAPEDNSRVTTQLTREVDDAIGLLSLGLYEPPRPHDQAEQDVAITGEETPATPAATAPSPAPGTVEAAYLNPETENDRRRRREGLDPENPDAPPAQPAAEPQPAPGQ